MLPIHATHFLINNCNITGNSVAKCFAVSNVIKDVLLTLKPNIYCFCYEHHYQHAFVLLENFAYPSNNRINRISKTMYSVICSYEKYIFGSNLFQNKSQRMGIP